MQTTIETIGGKLCTVIRKPFDADWVREQLSMGIPVVGELPRGERIPFYILDIDQEFYDYPFVVTILPALPRHPKPEDAPLLYRYAAEGIHLSFVWGNYTEEHYEMCTRSSGIVEVMDYIQRKQIPLPTFSHAIDAQGNRHEIAITDDVL